MQNPRGVAHGVIEFIPISSGPGQGDGIKQGDACTLTFELNQPILVSIAEAGRPLGLWAASPDSEPVASAIASQTR